jgi:hypothetical protein
MLTERLRKRYSESDFLMNDEYEENWCCKRPLLNYQVPQLTCEDRYTFVCIRKPQTLMRLTLVVLRSSATRRNTLFLTVKRPRKNDLPPSPSPLLKISLSATIEEYLARPTPGTVDPYEIALFPLTMETSPATPLFFRMKCDRARYARPLTNSLEISSFLNVFHNGKNFKKDKNDP